MNTCKNCGIVINKRRQYCSHKCANTSPGTIKKKQETMLKKYGVKNPSHSDELKKKREDTMILKYGVKNPSHSDELKKKREDIFIQKFNGNPFQNNEIKEKIKQTNLKKYGVKYSQQSSEHQQWRQKKYLERKGSWHPKQNHNPLAFEKLLDYSWLFKEYVECRKTALQISEELQVHSTTVCNYLHLYNILIRRISAFSYKAIQWLEHVSQNENIFIQHAGNVGEYQIPNTNFFADGFCKETNTIYEFHGDAWHGNPEIYLPNEHCHPFDPKITAGELYEKTVIRDERFHSYGYNVVSIWENDWNTS